MQEGQKKKKRKKAEGNIAKTVNSGCVQLVKCRSYLCFAIFYFPLFSSISTRATNNFCDHKNEIKTINIRSKKSKAFFHHCWFRPPLSPCHAPKPVSQTLTFIWNGNPEVLWDPQSLRKESPNLPHWTSWGRDVKHHILERFFQK